MKGKLKRDYWIIKLSGFFDPFYYLKQYPDVRKMDIDPLEHYVLFGWKEGKNPNFWFDTSSYIKANSDIDFSKINPFAYWILHEKFYFINLFKKIRRELSIENIRLLISYIKSFGAKVLIKKIKAKILIFKKVENQYQRWIRLNEPSQEQLEEQKRFQFPISPKISIVTPVYNTDSKHLIEMIESVLAQTYSRWELCIVDGNSSKPEVKEILEQYKHKDKRIKIKYLSENKGIAENTNEAIKIATGDYIAFLDHDDVLSPFALFEVVKAINKEPQVDFIYSDEDKISSDSKLRYEPHFKPSWNPELLRSCNYITHLIVVKKELLDSVGWLRNGFEGSQDYDLILRCTERANKIVHIPKILYHWRAHVQSTAKTPNIKLYAFESGKKALREHLERKGFYDSKVDILYPYFGWYKINYKLKYMPKVSLIVSGLRPQRCINSIFSKSTYKNFEIILITPELINITGVRLIRWKNRAWWHWASANNYAVKFSSGEVLLFLHSDTEVITSDWIERMLEHIQKDEVGIVGVKLYYPDNTIQHAGVIMGIKGSFGYSHRNYPKEHPGYFGRLISVQNVSAVSGSCMMVKRKVFNELGGFDESYSLVSDIDFCLRARKKGYLIVWTPFAELYHYDKKNTFIPMEEIKRFQTKWSEELQDPYYNPNLTLEKEDFSISI